jgi:hypothetical protein
MATSANQGCQVVQISSVSALLAPRPAEGHPGWAEFDERAEVTFEGTVTDYLFVNPHCVVEFNVKDEKGQIHIWQSEFSNPEVLACRGWNAASLQPGEKITITGHPLRNSAPALHVTKIRLSNGELKLDLRE